MSTATAFRQPSFVGSLPGQRQQSATVPPPVRFAGSERITDDKLRGKIGAYHDALTSIDEGRRESETTAAAAIEETIQAACNGETGKGIEQIRKAIANRANSEFAFLVAESKAISDAKALAADLATFAAADLKESEKQKESMREIVAAQLEQAGLGLTSQRAFGVNPEAAQRQLTFQIERSEQMKAATVTISEANQVIQIVQTFARQLDARKAAIVSMMRELVSGLAG